MLRASLHPRLESTVTCHSRVRRRRRRRQASPECGPIRLLLRSSASDENNSSRQEKSDKDGLGNRDTGPLLRAVWYAAELGGQIVGRFAKSEQEEKQTGHARDDDASYPISRSDLVQSIKDDYERNYFISGQGDMQCYASDCLFSDPFVSFRGTQRFKDNVGNLGAMLESSEVKILKWDEGESSITVTWLFRGILSLPWKPLLAARGRTTHVLDTGSGIVTEHREEWDVDPKTVVVNLLKPSKQKQRQGQVKE